MKYLSISLLIVFVGAFLFDKIVMPLYVHLGDEIDVPDVTAKNEFEAIVQLRNLGFKVDPSDGKYDQFHQAGTVLSQNPLPFTRVKRGRIVHLTVSLGMQKIMVPNLISLSQRDAELELSKHNLVRGEVFYNTSPDFPDGVVMNQSYEPGLEVKKGAVIDITVSLGQEIQEIRMPDVQFKTLETASDIIAKSRITLSSVDYQTNNDYLPNTVLFQLPPPGQIMSPGDSVRLIVSNIDSTQTKRKFPRK